MLRPNSLKVHNKLYAAPVTLRPKADTDERILERRAASDERSMLPRRGSCYRPRARSRTTAVAFHPYVYRFDEAPGRRSAVMVVDQAEDRSAA